MSEVGEGRLLCSAKLLCHVILCVTPWTVDRQIPLSMGILQARILEWCGVFRTESVETRDQCPKGENMPMNEGPGLLEGILTGL